MRVTKATIPQAVSKAEDTAFTAAAPPAPEFEPQSTTLQMALRVSTTTPFVYNGGNKDQPNFPPLIHLTWKNKQLPWRGQTCLDQWRIMNPDHQVLLWTDDDLDAFFKRFYPQWYAMLMSLPKPVLRADLFRYMVLYVFGGVYADVDVCPLKPVREWLTADAVDDQQSNVPITAVLGVEADNTRPDWREYWPRQLQICQWTFASVPGHAIWADTIYRSARKLEEMWRAGGSKSWNARQVQDNILELTGPALFTDVVMSFFDQAGLNTTFDALHNMPRPRQMDDVLLLTITGFSPGRNAMNSQPVTHRQALVEHHFQGSWKDQ
ncbi:hypothetical protein RI367_003458 [Sorochytrium milnesiophthora]